jgi:hypothetical protein
MIEVVDGRIQALAASAAILAPQILRGYQWVEPGFGAG